MVYCNILYYIHNIRFIGSFFIFLQWKCEGKLYRSVLKCLSLSFRSTHSRSYQINHSRQQNLVKAENAYIMSFKLIRWFKSVYFSTSVFFCPIFQKYHITKNCNTSANFFTLILFNPPYRQELSKHDLVSLTIEKLPFSLLKKYLFTIFKCPTAQTEVSILSGQKVQFSSEKILI